MSKRDQNDFEGIYLVALRIINIEAPLKAATVYSRICHCFLRTVALLEEREKAIKSLHSDLQQKDNEIAGWSKKIINIINRIIFCSKFKQILYIYLYL